MSASIGVLGRDAQARKELALLAGECGHAVFELASVQDAAQAVARENLKALLVLDAAEKEGSLEIELRELCSRLPLLPVIAAPVSRDASRAVSLMRLGASEVLPWPWGRENLSAALSAALRFQVPAALSILPPPRRRSPALYAGLAVLAAAAAFSLWTVQARRERARAEAARHRVSRWDLPYSHPSSISFDGKDLWISDWFSRTLYAHDPESLRILRSATLTSETPVALAFGSGMLWTAGAGGEITSRMRNAGLSKLVRYPAKAFETAGMAYDGLYLWTLGPKKFFKRILDSDLTVVQAYQYPGTRPAGLAFDGKSLWTIDAGKGLLLRHDLEKPERIVAVLALPQYKDGRFKPVGLAWDGAGFWSVAEPALGGPARIFKHEIR